MNDTLLYVLIGGGLLILFIIIVNLIGSGRLLMLKPLIEQIIVELDVKFDDVKFEEKFKMKIAEACRETRKLLPSGIQVLMPDKLIDFIVKLVYDKFEDRLEELKQDFKDNEQKGV